MSLLPLLFDDFQQVRPSHHHHHRTCGRNNILLPEEFIYPMKAVSQVLNKLSQIDKDTSITQDKDHFQASIDVQQFKPEEISVKFNGDHTVTVEGKHEEKQDEHGFISRHFLRRYVLPEDCDVKKLQSKLSTDGVLMISAPKKPEGKQLDYKQIPITFTGPVKKSLEPQEDLRG